MHLFRLNGSLRLLSIFMVLTIVGCSESSQNKETPSKVDSIEPDHSTTSTPDDQYLVIPGKKLGNFELNHRADRILDSLPPPDNSDASMGKVLLTWNHLFGDSLFLFNTQKMGVENYKRIKIVRSLSSNFKTQEGLGVHSTLKELKAHYTLKKTGIIQEGSRSYTLLVDSQGIGFEVNSDKICRAIVLFLPNGIFPNAYIPFYRNYQSVQKE